MYQWYLPARTKLKYYFCFQFLILISLLPRIAVLSTRIVLGDPRPMVEHKFNNKYNMILCAVSLLLDRFDKEHQVFAAECIWWLACIIKVTEILVYYRHNETFLSDYIINFEVTPWPSTLPEWSFIPESVIPVSDINHDSDSEVISSRWELPPKSKNKNQAKLNTTCSGKVFKNTKCQEPSIQHLQARFGNPSKKQRWRTHELLRSGELNIEGEYGHT